MGTLWANSDVPEEILYEEVVGHIAEKSRPTTNCHLSGVQHVV